MKKNIVLCSDGTGNTMMKGRGTNVWKLYEAIDLTAHRWPESSEVDWVPGKEQVAFYDDGVGSEDSKILKVVGGAFGYGLSRNVRDLYKALCRAYVPGDDIYIFGFSRGAYTARVLAGMIAACGIVRHEEWETDEKLEELTKKAYQAFRQHFNKASKFGAQALAAHSKRASATRKLSMAEEAGKDESAAAVEKSETGQPAEAPVIENAKKTVAEAEKTIEKVEKLAREASGEASRETNAFREAHSYYGKEEHPEEHIRIKFLGVWDTVAAVGLPFKELTDFWNRIYPFKFPDYKLSEQVEKGCHAISIDDERHTFHPMMWDERDEVDPDRIEQVWFAGVHSNVGGGYPKQGISLVALDWMMDRASEAKLKFIKSERDRYRHLQNVHDKLYDSRTGLAVYYRYKPRDIEIICEEFGVAPCVHVSALERVALATGDYSPGNLPPQFQVVTTDSHAGVNVDNPEALADLGQTFGPEKASTPVERWISVRRNTHVILILFSLVFLGLAAWYHAVKDGDGERPWLPSRCYEIIQNVGHVFPGKIPFELLIDPFLMHWEVALVTVFFLAGIRYLSRRARGELQREFRNYWRKRLPRPWWSNTNPD